MIQEWKEVCIIPSRLHGLLDANYVIFRKDTVVDGRSGRNKLRDDAGWTWYQTSYTRSICTCTNTVLDVGCMGRAWALRQWHGTTVQVQMYIIVNRIRPKSWPNRINHLRPRPHPQARVQFDYSYWAKPKQLKR